MHRTFAVVSFAFVCTLPGLAAAQDGAPPCLSQRQVYDWQPDGDHAVIAIDRAHRKYRINFTNVCNGLDFKMRIGFRSQGRSTLACLGHGDQVVVGRSGPFPGQRCIIGTIENYTPQMERADADAKAQH